jgi:hypothetical protein
LNTRTGREERQVPDTTARARGQAAGPYRCPYCRTACEGGTSACPNCGAPQNRPGDFLASDGDRDQAISKLTDHFQAGRLTIEEFDERSGRALHARTQGELTALLVDLPPGQAPVTDPVTSAGGVRSRLPGRISRIWVVLIVIVISLAVSSAHDHHSLVGLVPAGAVLLFVLRRRAGAGRRLGEDDQRQIAQDLRRDGRRLRRDGGDLLRRACPDRSGTRSRRAGRGHAGRFW